MDTADLPNQPPRNIVLVGFMGSGKSTLGKILHKRISYHLVDTDHLIEGFCRLAFLLCRRNLPTHRQNQYPPTAAM